MWRSWVPWRPARAPRSEGHESNITVAAAPGQGNTSLGTRLLRLELVSAAAGLRRRWNPRQQCLLNDMGAMSRRARVALELRRQQIVTTRSGALRHVVGERGIFLECAQRGPQRLVELVGLAGQQRIRRPGMTDATPVSLELPILDLPEDAAAIRAAELRRPSRVYFRRFDCREIELRVRSLAHRIVVHRFLP